MNLPDIPTAGVAFRFDMYVILACTRGTMQLAVGGVPYTIGERDVLVCLPNHRVDDCRPDADFEGMALCVSPKALGEIVNENSMWEYALRLMGRPVVHVSDESVCNLVEYGRSIDAAIRSSHRQFRKRIILSLVSACLYELMSNVEVDEKKSGASRLTRKDYLFRSFVELLAGRDVKPRTVQWYADELCVTPKYLSVVCKEISGRTAFQWISEAVEKDITHWLRNSDRSIKEIAHLLQFTNNSFFGKYCRQHFGMPPTEYREFLRQGGKR